MLPLTKRQREIFDFLSEFIQLHGYAPSLEEIGRKFGLSSLATMRKHQASAEAADKEFYKNFPQYMEEAKKILGKMFHAEDYPNVNELQDKFSFTLVALPMPDVADWRVDIPAKELDALRKAAGGALDELQKAAVMDLWARVQDVVEHVVERLKKSDSKFKNSLIGNVKEIVELLPKLNITADAKLTEIQKALEQKLCKLNPDELREDDGMRSKAASDAEAILKRMASYMGAPKK